jgi:predicted solute-binding protein
VWAGEGRLEATAMSVGAYPGVQDVYRLLGHGASLGEGPPRSSPPVWRSRPSSRCSSTSRRSWMPSPRAMSRPAW